MEFSTLCMRIAYKWALIFFPYLHYFYSFGFPPFLEVNVPPIAAYLSDLWLPVTSIITQNGNRAALDALIMF
jgi:hypothetical protein